MSDCLIDWYYTNNKIEAVARHELLSKTSKSFSAIVKVGEGEGCNDRHNIMQLRVRDEVHSTAWGFLAKDGTTKSFFPPSRNVICFFVLHLFLSFIDDIKQRKNCPNLDFQQP